MAKKQPPKKAVSKKAAAPKAAPINPADLQMMADRQKMMKKQAAQKQIANILKNM